MTAKDVHLNPRRGRVTAILLGKMLPIAIVLHGIRIVLVTIVVSILVYIGVGMINSGSIRLSLSVSFSGEVFLFCCYYSPYLKPS